MRSIYTLARAVSMRLAAGANQLAAAQLASSF